jgi:hypothetical protein
MLVRKGFQAGVRQCGIAITIAQIVVMVQICKVSVYLFFANDLAVVIKNTHHTPINLTSGRVTVKSIVDPWDPRSGYQSKYTHEIQ